MRRFLFTFLFIPFFPSNAWADSEKPCADFKKPELDSWEETGFSQLDKGLNDSAIRNKLKASKNQEKKELIDKDKKERVDGDKNQPLFKKSFETYNVKQNNETPTNFLIPNQKHR